MPHTALVLSGCRQVNATCISCSYNAFLGLQVNVSLSLVGENASPVTASLSVFHRSNASSSTALPAKLQQDEALYWDVGEYGSPKTVTVTLLQAVRRCSGCCRNRAAYHVTCSLSAWSESTVAVGLSSNSGR